MIARMPAAPSLRTALAVLVCRRALARGLAGLALVLFATSPALALGPYVWPANGAPVCNASGDQHRIFQSGSGCGGLEIAWLQSLPGADSLKSASIGIVPPEGDGCSSYPQPIEATGALELSSAEVRSGLIAIALPYCIPPQLAQCWIQGTGAASQVVVNNSQSFFPQSRIVVDDGDFVRHHPRMAGSGAAYRDTAVVAVWSDERTGVPQIRAQRVNEDGAREWGPAGILVAPTGAAQTDPEIARLGNGSTLVVWSDARSGGSDVYAMCLLPDGSPAPGWPAQGLALEARAEVSGSPRIAGQAAFADPEYVVWEESGSRFGGGRSIVARRLVAGGTPDPAWDPLGVPLSTSATVEHLQDVSDTYGDLVAVWTDTRAASPSNPTDLYAQWLEPSGEPETGWPAAGLAICTAPGRQDAARVSASTSYAAFAWEDHRGADADVYAVLRLSNGTLQLGQWQPNGLPATSAPGDQTAPVIGAGNGGGCFVAWQDARDLATTGLDIYAQAFTSEGEKLDVPPGSPRALWLGPARPNPMRNTTMFTLQSPRAGPMHVEVLDVAGRRVRVLATGEFSAGTREIAFDGLDDGGRELPPGVYRVRARVGEEVSSRTLVRIH